MQHITYRPIDRQFRCLERDLPPGAPFNRVDPIDGITFGFALESRFPEEVYFGTVNETVTNNPKIELFAISVEAYNAAYEAEQIAKNKQFVPSVITMRQAKITLSRTGYLKSANEAIANMAGQQGEEARIEWEYATSLRRDHPLVTGIGLALDLIDEEIDSLFIEADNV